MERVRIGLNRQNKPRCKLKPGDVFPGDPKWERIGDRVIRRYKGTNKPEGVLYGLKNGRELHTKRENILVKEAKEFRKQHETT